MNDMIITGKQEITNQEITSGMFERFIAYLDVSPKSVQTYTRALRQFALWMDRNGITQPHREDIIRYREELSLSHKATTVTAYINAVRLFFRWTAQEGLYPDISDHIKGKKISREPKKDYLTGRQVKKVLAAAAGEGLEELRNYAMLSLMFTAGLRTIEVVRADIEDMRTLGDEDEDYTVLYLQGKGDDEKSKFVRIVPQVEQAIRRYLKARGKVSGTDPMFTSCSNNSYGQRLSTRSVSGIVKEAFRAAGYDSSRLTAHSTRHTAVTLALLAGEDIQKVQKFARHSNIDTTLIYSHVLEKAKDTCAESIASSIF